MENVALDKKHLTNEQLGDLIERIEANEWKRTSWYPTMSEAEEIAQDPVGNYEFIIWILYSNPDQELNDEQLSVEQYLEKVLKEATVLIDDGKKAGGDAV